MMEIEALKARFIKEYSLGSVHPLHLLVLDECCETALQLGGARHYATLKTAVSVGFLTCLSGLRAVVSEGLKEYDRVKIVYRGETFIFETVDEPAFHTSGFNFIKHEN